MALKDNWIAKNLIWAAVFVVVLLLAVSIGLRLITRHGKTVSTPDFTGLSVEQAEELATQEHVKVKVVDSVFMRRLPGGVVYRQQPKVGATVKKDRSIFLTINSVVPRKVVMPNLLGYSTSEAISQLHNRGLDLGRLNYVRDIATNTVLGQSVNGVAVSAGDLVVSGSAVDLKVGVSYDENRTVVPKLVGLKYVSAVDALHERFLNVGAVRFDKDIRTYADSMAAVVYRQDAPGAVKALGTPIAIYLTLDSSKLPTE